MATNKFIKFGTWNNISENTLTDDQLVGLTPTEKEGLVYGSYAYTNILNALLRQTTMMTSVFANLVSVKSDKNINTSITNQELSDRIEEAIENISLEVAVKIASITNSASVRSDIVINSQGLVTTFKDLAAADIPPLAISKITGLQTALDAKAPLTRTIAGLTLEANRSRDDIIGVSSNGLVKRTGANSYTVDNTAYTPQSRKIAGLTLNSDHSRDDVIGVSANGYLKRTGANTYTVDNSTFALSTDVVVKKQTGDIAGNILIWRGTETQYNNLTIGNDDNNIYIII